MRGVDKRLEKVEDALLVGQDRREFERLRRHHYNLRGGAVSTEGLLVSLIAAVGQFDPPAWVKTEFDRPLPADAHLWLVREAEVRALETLSAEASAVPIEDLEGRLAIEVPRTIATLSEFVGQPFATVNDVRLWCEDEGQHYKPCNILTVALERRSNDDSEIENPET